MLLLTQSPVQDEFLILQGVNESAAAQILCSLFGSG
jgi:hypothetical protein